MQQLTERPLSVLSTWRAALNLWKTSFTKVLPFTIPWSLWMLVPFVVLDYVDVQVNYWFILGTLGWLFGSLIFYAAVYHRIYYCLVAKSSNTVESLALAIRKIPVLAIALIIFSVVFMGGFLLLVLPGIYLLVPLLFYYPLIVIDDLNPISALTSAVKIIQNHWWRTAIIVYVPAVIFMLVVLTVEYYILGFHHFTFGPVPSKTNYIIWFFHHVLSLIFSIFYIPLFASMIIVQLRNLTTEYHSHHPMKGTKFIFDSPEGEAKIKLT